MRTLVATILTLSTLAGPALADDASRDVMPSIYEMQRVPGEARQAATPTARSRDFPDRGYGTASNAAMIRDVQAASASGRYTAPSRPQPTPTR